MIYSKKKRKSFSEYPINLSTGKGKMISSLQRINKAILSTLNYEKVVEEVVNLVLQELDYLKLGYKISVLTIVDKKEKVVKRISFSPTKEAWGVLKKGNVKFHEVKIPLTAKENVLVRAIKDKKVYITHDLSDVFYPEKTREVWREVQKQVGIETSLIFPLIVRDESIGAMIFSLTKNEKKITDEEKGILSGFTDAVAVALENANLYRRLQQINTKLKYLDKQKNEFISVAAHELRAPMTAIKGFLSMIMEGDAGRINDKVKDYLAEAVQGNDRLIRLVNNMLNVSRIEEGRMVYKMGNINLAKAAETVFNEFKITAQDKKLKISLNISSGLKDKVNVDQDRIHEVISNLISNAIKYTDKGSISINLSQPDKNTVRLEVKDTGLGISEEEQKKLFEKFVQTSSGAGKQMGSGLGLYITKLLVEKFGGKLGLESEESKGSTFWFELPVKS